MKCIYCKKDIEEGMNFCPYCGKSQHYVMKCSECGKECTSMDYHYCPDCGAEMNEYNKALERLVYFKDDGKYGYQSYLDKKVYIKPEYEEADSFKGDKAWVRKDGKYGCIDWNGKPVSGFKFDQKPYFNCDNIGVTRQGQNRLLIDFNGNVISEVVGSVTMISRSTENHFNSSRVKNQEKYWLWMPNQSSCGVIDSNGNIIIPSGQFDNIQYLDSDKFAVSNHRRYGISGKDGCLVLPCEYDNIYSNGDGCAIVCKNQLFGIFNMARECFSLQCEYDEILFASSSFYGARKKNLWTVVNRNSRETIYADKMWRVEFESTYVIEKNGKSSYFDAEGNPTHAPLIRY